jgi:hypothetical protein
MSPHFGFSLRLDVGFNHSGKDGVINFLDGVMGVANAQRMMNYIRIFTEFISQPEYQNVVPVFSIINEPRLSAIGQDTLTTLFVTFTSISPSWNLIRRLTFTAISRCTT